MSADTSVANGIRMIRPNGPVTQRRACWAAAWEKFFRHLYRLVTAAVRRRVGERHAEEAAQIAFQIGMDKGLPLWITDRVTLLRYLARVAACRALNLLRADERAVLESDLPPGDTGKGGLPDAADPSVAPDDLVVAKSEVERLQGLLTPEQREVVRLGVDEGLSNPQVAKRIGCSRRLVELHRKNIRERLLGRLDDEQRQFVEWLCRQRRRSTKEEAGP